MRFCPHCAASNGDDYVRCHRCGRSLIREPALKGAAEFGNPGVNLSREVHRRHRWLDLRVACAASVAVQLLLVTIFAFVRDWTLAVHAVAAVACTLAVHKLRLGPLASILLTAPVTVLVLLVTGHMQGLLAVSAFIAIWVLSFWYAFLGMQLQLNNEVHGK